MSETTGILWIDIIILLILPICIGPLFLFLKSLWDRYNSYKTKNKQLLYDNRVNSIRNKLVCFYWPIYVHLLKDYILWSTIRYGRINKAQLSGESDDTVSEESEYSDYDVDEFSRCIYIKSTGVRCQNIVPTLFNTKTRHYCIRHHLKNEPSNTFKEFSIDPESREITIIKPEITAALDISDEIIKNMKHKLTINHNKIAEIIEKNIAIAEPNRYTGKLLMRYIHFANVTNTIIEVDDNIDKLDIFNVKYPKKLLPIIEKELLELQEKYNDLLENY